MAYKRSYGARSVIRSGLGRTAAASALGYGIRKISSYFKPKRGAPSRVSTMSRMRRRTRTYTSVARRLKTRTAAAENMSSNYAKFVYGYGPRRKPRLSRAVAPVTQYYNGTLRMNGISGFQHPFEPLALYDRNDLAILDGALSANPNDWMRHLGCTLKMMFTNQNEAPVKLKVYHCLSRRDNNQTPLNTWSNGGTNQISSADPVQNILGSSPMCIQEFTQTWVVKKMSIIDLPPGGNATVTVVAKNHALIKEKMFRTGASVYLSGLTYFPLIVVNGYPINSESTTAITTAPVAVDLIWTKQYTFTSVARSTQSGSANNFLPVGITTIRGVKQEDGTAGPLVTV